MGFSQYFAKTGPFMMNRTLRAGLLVMAPVLLLSGCAGKFVKPVTPSVVVIPPPSGKDGGNYTLEKYKTDLAAYSSASESASATDVAKAIRLRNKMAYSLMAEIDYVFGDYETKLFLNEGSFHVASDFVQLGLAAGSTVAIGARGKTILSALLSGVTGTSLSVDKNFFRQQTVEAITSSMEANRDRIKTIILQQLKQDTTTYPFEAARSDLIKYFFAGTLSGGLLELHQTAAANAKTQQGKMNQVQVTNISAVDVKSITDLNAAIAQAFSGNAFAEVVAWLTAMGSVSDSDLKCTAGKCDATSQEKIESSIRDLGNKILTDEALRKKYFDEARKAKLIQ
jgi:hypothetical protein